MKQKLTLLVIACVLLCGCRKEAGMYLDCVTESWLSQAKGGQKTYIDSDNFTCWIDGDSICLNGVGVCLSVTTGTSTTVRIPIPDGVNTDGGYYAFYPASMVTGYSTVNGSVQYTVSLPVIQRYEEDGLGHQIVRAPMGARCSPGGNTLQFLNLCSVVCVEVPIGTQVSEIAVGVIENTDKQYSDGSVSFLSTEDTITFSMGNTNGSDQYCSVMLTGENMQRADGKYYVVLPPTQTATGCRYEVAVKFFENETIYYKSVKQSQNSRLERGTIGVVPFNPYSGYKKPISYRGRLIGGRRYTIRLNGQTETLYFSTGNLQYKQTLSSGGSWRFSPTQYFTSRTGGNRGWIDHFGFGTSGWNGGGSTYYHPTDEQYSPTLAGYGYGPLASGTPQSLTGTYAQADWGVYNRNSIISGTQESGTWRVLTKTEWKLLLQRANQNASTPYTVWGLAKVCGVSGILLYPNKSPISDSLPYSGQSRFTNHLFSPTKWLKMESCGAVFLPADGYRGDINSDDGTCEATSFTAVGEKAYYWSSNASSAGKSSCLILGASNSGNQDTASIEKYCGLSVRLVYVP